MEEPDDWCAAFLRPPLCHARAARWPRSTTAHTTHNVSRSLADRFRGSHLTRFPQRGETFVRPRTPAQHHQHGMDPVTVHK